jgi:hypothetical protein
VRVDRVGLARALEHEQLREDGDGLEEDGEGPEDLHGREAVVEHERTERGGPDEVLDLERVDGRVVRRPGGRQHAGGGAGGATDRKRVRMR